MVRHFGWWRRAKEALALSDTETVRRIEARFRFRKMGKVWRYIDDTRREALARCVEHYGRSGLRIPRWPLRLEIISRWPIGLQSIRETRRSELIGRP